MNETRNDQVSIAFRLLGLVAQTKPRQFPHPPSAVSIAFRLLGLVARGPDFKLVFLPLRLNCLSAFRFSGTRAFIRAGPADVERVSIAFRLLGLVAPLDDEPSREETV